MDYMRAKTEGVEFCASMNEIGNNVTDGSGAGSKNSDWFIYDRNGEKVDLVGTYFRQRVTQLNIRLNTTPTANNNNNFYYYMDDCIIDTRLATDEIRSLENSTSYTITNNITLNIESYTNRYGHPITYIINSSKLSHLFILGLIDAFLNVWTVPFTNISLKRRTTNNYTYKINYSTVTSIGEEHTIYINKCIKLITDNMSMIGDDKSTKYLNYLYKTKYVSIFYQTDYLEERNIFLVQQYITKSSNYLYGSSEFYSSKYLYGSEFYSSPNFWSSPNLQSSFKLQYLKSIMNFINNYPTTSYQPPTVGNNPTIIYYMNITNILTYGILKPSNSDTLSRKVLATTETYKTIFDFIKDLLVFDTPKMLNCPIISLSTTYYDTQPYLYFSKVLYTLLMLVMS